MAPRLVSNPDRCPVRSTAQPGFLSDPPHDWEQRSHATVNTLDWFEVCRYCGGRKP